MRRFDFKSIRSNEPKSFTAMRGRFSWKYVPFLDESYSLNKMNK